jgi:hypothetical protein
MTRLTRDAADAWASEKEAAYKAVEEVWGKRGGGGLLGRKGKMRKKELRKWYKERVEHGGERDGLDGAEEERVGGGGDGGIDEDSEESEEPVMMRENGAREGEESRDDAGNERGEAQGNGDGAGV